MVANGQCSCIIGVLSLSEVEICHVGLELASQLRFGSGQSEHLGSKRREHRESNSMYVHPNFN